MGEQVTVQKIDVPVQPSESELFNGQDVKTHVNQRVVATLQEKHMSNYLN